jgi:hypothetical protein
MNHDSLVYTRIAHPTDHRPSRRLAAQEEACRADARRHGLTISPVIREARGAGRPGRPGIWRPAPCRSRRFRRCLPRASQRGKMDRTSGRRLLCEATEGESP